ncbi:MAG TPA: DUF2079 domain-containing protein [Candidatus Baltobacteraceae bacterium]|nr:DUF2079 domain-containing protein [Candidatus Baltobacteraceae bacterium]
MRDRFLWIAVALYAALFTFLGAAKFAVHRNFVDFGIFAQTTASAFGCFCNTVEGSHWAVHFSPILYLAGAVVWFWHSPYALIALQSIALALVMPPVYGLVARRAPRSVARLAVLVVFLYPALAGLAFNDFHENDFAPAAVAWMLWAFDGGYVSAAFLFAALALAVKEDQAIFLIAAGAFGYVRFRNTATGRAALAVGVAAAIVAGAFVLHIQPAAATNPHWSPERFYSWTPADVRALFFGGILARAGFFVLAFMPLLFLPFRSGMMWLAALPIAEVVLSRMPTTFTMGSHYAGAWLGYVFAAFAVAVRSMPAARSRRALLWCAAICVVELLVANPLHPGLNLHRPQARDRALDSYLATLPNDISVASQEEAYTHLALRDPYATVLPEDASLPVAAPFALIDRDYPESPRLQEYGGALDRPCFVAASQRGAITLYRALCAGSRSSRSDSSARTGQ